MQCQQHFGTIRLPTIGCGPCLWATVGLAEDKHGQPATACITATQARTLRLKLAQPAHIVEAEGDYTVCDSMLTIAMKPGTTLRLQWNRPTRTTLSQEEHTDHEHSTDQSHCRRTGRRHLGELSVPFSGKRHLLCL